MIAFIDNLPLLEFDGGGVFAFRKDWLRINLLQAAARAGYRDWWLADHVAKSVTNYLVSQYENNVLPAADLRTSVVQVLSTIGYAEIAREFVPTRPPRHFSLLELAQAAGLHEMIFFGLLREVIDRELQERSTSIVFLHLAAAVKLMLGVKLFTEECARFREEIVAFSAPLPTLAVHLPPSVFCCTSMTLFEKLIHREIPSEIVYEDDTVFAFRDIEPQAPHHILIVPKKVIPRLDEAEPDDRVLLGNLLYSVAQIARQLGLATDGYRVVINNGADAGESVPHLHLHLLAGRQLTWPPG